MEVSTFLKCPAIGVVCLLASACSSSSPSRTHDAGSRDAGHDSTGPSGDAGTDATLGPPDAGYPGYDAGPMPDVNPCIPDVLNPGDVQVYSPDAAATWTALYDDYFGPSATLSSCGGGAGGTGCHGSTASQGYSVSHFLCPMTGDAKTACWKGMTSSGDGGANLIERPFNDGGLGTILCQNYCLGIMPLDCNYYFTPADMQRIQNWVSAGAKND